MKKYSAVLQLMKRVVVYADTEDEARRKVIDDYFLSHNNSGEYDVFCDRNDVEELTNK